MRRIRTASITTLGCKLNQSESDEMARHLADAGVTLRPFGEPADLCVINTCTVTHIGDRKSRQTIRQAARKSPGAFIVVAGCFAELEPDAARAIEGVGAVLGNEGKADLIGALRRYSLEIGDESAAAGPAAGEAHPLPGRSRVSGQPARTRAFVKIQDGCDCNCSYCIVPKARGHQRSRPAGDVVDEIRRLVSQGYQEAVLTGVNITAYGRDHGSPLARDNARGAGLLGMLSRVLEETDLPRLRLSSLQPEDWTPAFYDPWAGGRLCRHLHLSLQSGSNAVLRSMRRRYNAEQYARIVEEARSALPGVAITTDVIVGFPGEGDAEHKETEDFLRAIGFAGLHVFKYSPRSGTDAAEMAGQVSPAVKQDRSDRLLALAGEMSEEFNRRSTGEVLSVLWEEPVSTSEALRIGLTTSVPAWRGLSDNYIRVYGASSSALGGTITGARVERLAGDGVLARPLRGRNHGGTESTVGNGGGG